MVIEVRIPGEPVAQGRPRFARVGEHVRAIDPKKSRNWKATAQQHMVAAGAKPVPAGVPVVLSVVAAFSCPKSDYRKREPRGVRWHTKRPDLDNVVKAVKDAGSGVLWIDDSQVVFVKAIKVIAGQGEAPFVWVCVDDLLMSRGPGYMSADEYLECWP